MAEYILATGEMRSQIIAELQEYRENYTHSLREMHPHISFLPLSVLATHPCYAVLIDQTFLQKAIALLVKRLHDYGPYDLLDPARVWIGIAMAPSENHERLHDLIIGSMLSGKMKELCSYFDATLSSRRSFVHLFKSSTY